MRAIFVFGGIGAGKTTVARALASALGAPLVREPFDENPFLPLYAQDRARWAFTCQTYYYLQYVREYERTLREMPRQLALLKGDPVEPMVVIDAGAPTNKHVYARYMREHGLVTPDEYALYETLTAMMDAQYVYPEPTEIVYVNPTLDIALDRLWTRGRDFELAGHTPDYVMPIAMFTEDMLAHFRSRQVPIVEFDSSQHDVRAPDGIAVLMRALRSI